MELLHKMADGQGPYGVINVLLLYIFLKPLLQSLDGPGTSGEAQPKPAGIRGILWPLI